MQKETANMVSMKEQFEEQASPAGRRSVSRSRTSRGGASPEGAAAAATADADGGDGDGDHPHFQQKGTNFSC